MTTRNKRASALLVGLAFRAILPAPDGAVGSLDRLTVATLYALEAIYSDVASVPEHSNLLALDPFPSVAPVSEHSNLLTLDQLPSVTSVPANSNLLVLDPFQSVMPVPANPSIVDGRKCLPSVMPVAANSNMLALDQSSVTAVPENSSIVEKECH